MENIGIIVIIVWGISGIINLSCKEIDKFNYFLTWVILMFYLVAYYYGF